MTEEGETDERAPAGENKVRDYAIRGLCTDGAHHKQWILERILDSLGYDVEQLRKKHKWEPGIPP